MGRTRSNLAPLQNNAILLGIAYARVSTDEQVLNKDGSYRDDASPYAQEKRCNDHIRYLSTRSGKQYEVIETIKDEGYSGGNTNRPGYQRMLEMINRREVGFIVCAELSRISRSVKDFQQLLEQCKQNNVEVFIIGLDFDPNTPMGEMILNTMVNLAQFERKQTGLRVKENALARLLSNGKINGSAEILGLDRDPSRRGHYIRNDVELARVKQLFEMYLRLPSKKAVLDEANKIGIMGKNNQLLSERQLEYMCQNTRWRYRGLWYANKENEGKDNAALPDSKRYQVIKLSHGPLIDLALLDLVQHKLEDTYAKRKKTGKDNYVYLLTKVLRWEDGSTFQGNPCSNRQYRYYHNPKIKLRIKCHELDELVINRLKSYFSDNDLFAKMVANAIKKREQYLPELEVAIRKLDCELAAIDKDDERLKSKLMDPKFDDDSEFMPWLLTQVKNIKERREAKQAERRSLESQLIEGRRKSDLNDLQKVVKELVGKFDKLTPTEQRNYIERIIKQIIVYKDNRIEIVLLGEPNIHNVTRRKITEWEINGGQATIQNRHLSPIQN